MHTYHQCFPTLSRQEDTLRIIWSFNDVDPVALDGPDGPQYHSSNRGSKSVILLQKSPPNLDLQDGNVITFDMMNPNVSLCPTVLYTAIAYGSNRIN